MITWRVSPVGFVVSESSATGFPFGPKYRVWTVTSPFSNFVSVVIFFAPAPCPSQASVLEKESFTCAKTAALQQRPMQITKIRHATWVTALTFKLSLLFIGHLLSQAKRKLGMASHDYFSRLKV